MDDRAAPEGAALFLFGAAVHGVFERKRRKKFRQKIREREGFPCGIGKGLKRNAAFGERRPDRLHFAGAGEQGKVLRKIRKGVVSREATV